MQNLLAVIVFFNVLGNDIIKGLPEQKRTDNLLCINRLFCSRNDNETTDKKLYKQ